MRDGALHPPPSTNNKNNNKLINNKKNEKLEDDRDNTKKDYKLIIVMNTFFFFKVKGTRKKIHAFGKISIMGCFLRDDERRQFYEVHGYIGTVPLDRVCI